MCICIFNIKKKKLYWNYIHDIITIPTIPVKKYISSHYVESEITSIPLYMPRLARLSHVYF